MTRVSRLAAAAVRDHGSGMRLLWVLAAMGCTSPATLPTEHACIVDRTCVDAGIDACAYVKPDAPSCCDLLPDVAAASRCAAIPGAAGELACEQPDCSFVVVGF